MVYIYLLKYLAPFDTCQPIVGNRSKLVYVYTMLYHIFTLKFDVSKVYGGVRLNPVHTIATIYS